MLLIVTHFYCQHGLQILLDVTSFMAVRWCGAIGESLFKSKLTILIFF